MEPDSTNAMPGTRRSDGTAMPPRVLDYHGMRPLSADWVVVARCATAAEWHATKQGLADANIDALMREDALAEGGLELLVQKENEPLARAILEARRAGQVNR